MSYLKHATTIPVRNLEEARFTTAGKIYTLDVVVSAAVDGGKLMGYFNLAWFAWGSAEMNLGDTVEYNTLVRVTSPYDRLATAIIKLFVHYHVRLTVYFRRTISVFPAGI